MILKETSVVCIVMLTFCLYLNIAKRTHGLLKILIFFRTNYRHVSLCSQSGIQGNLIRTKIILRI
jgi:hypothetical protein